MKLFRFFRPYILSEKHFSEFSNEDLLDALQREMDLTTRVLILQLLLERVIKDNNLRNE